MFERGSYNINIPSIYSGLIAGAKLYPKKTWPYTTANIVMTLKPCTYRKSLPIVVFEGATNRYQFLGKEKDKSNLVPNPAATTSF